MKAIEVRYHGPTESRGARMSARAEDCPTEFHTLDYSRTPDEQALSVAMNYATERGWSGSLVLGRLPRAGWAAVFVPSDDRATRLFNRAVAEIVAETAWEETI